MKKVTTAVIVTVLTVLLLSSCEYEPNHEYTAVLTLPNRRTTRYYFDSYAIDNDVITLYRSDVIYATLIVPPGSSFEIVNLFLELN